MSWRVVARKDFEDSIRSWWIVALSALFVVLFVVPAYFLAEGVGGAVVEQTGEQISSDAFISLLASFVAFLIPIVAIVLAYASVAGERDSGTLKLLLALPHSRRDVVLGKIVGRSAVIVLPVLVGFLAAAVVFLITPVSLEAGNYLAFALLSALLGVVFVSLSVGISAAAGTRRQAMLGNVGIYVIFSLFWGSFAEGLVNLLNEYTGAAFETLVRVQLAVRLLNPVDAYQSLAAILWTSDALGARLSLFGGGLAGQVYGQALDPLPAYFSDPVVAVAFLAWLAVPPLLGYLAFRDADL
ncbi:ABC transporter permease [Halalkalicoccus sp. NIPERK01]|uniref:ABC transporter permease n=1 Tax=Halalkalicoccus sp. NIPERK01 TaxID=3053469 RepID=UPI00256EB5C8|nr:ABC transporter permease [Halalkalicoccus sp. NIPERK01]MDL5362896.1 ABC transporter permease [Halalkalicoccus sp. NIPERK01]